MIDWKLDVNRIRLAPGTDWARPAVQAEARADAKLLSRTLRRPITIALGADDLETWAVSS